jgi:hypothetical protein
MPDTVISDNILGKCTFTGGVDASRVDGMTMVNIEPTTFSQLDTIYRDEGNAEWRVTETLLEADFRGKACLAKTNGFAEWLKGIAKVLDPSRLSMSTVKSDLKDILPYVKMEVENPINNQYWSWTDGTAAGDGETTPNLGATFQWKGVVAPQGNVPADPRWFGTRNTITILGVDAGTGGKVLASYKIKDAEVDGSGDLVLYLDNIGNNSADPLYSYDVTHYKRSNVVRGVLTRGLPNVTTAEAHCDNIPGLNMTQLKPFWIQHTRRTIREDDQYLKYVELIKANNPYFRKFGDVDSVRYNKQVQEDYDNRLVNTFLSNPALENQTEATVDQLEKVAWYAGDANSPSYTFEGRYQCRRANAIGYLEQLAECVDEDGDPALIDALGQKLDLAAMHRKYYLIQKVRKARGMDGKVIELWCSSQFRKEIIDAYITYFKTKSDSTLNINMNAQSNTLGFDWYDVKIDWPMVTLRLVSHQALDDYQAAAKAAAIEAGDNDATADTYSKVGTLAFCPDWSASYRSVIDSGTVTQETGTAQEIVRVDASMLCGPLVVPKQRVKHYWETFTTVVECGSSQVAWENFDPTGVDQS